MFRFKTILLYAFVVLCITSCKTIPLNFKETVISTEVENYSENPAIIINFCSPFSDSDRTACDLSKTGGKCSFEYKYAYPQNITIKYAGKFINVFITPGDSIHLKIDAEKMKNGVTEAVRFYGKNAEMSREINMYYEQGFPEIPLFDESSSYNDFINSIRKAIDSAKDSIESYAALYHSSKAFKEWAVRDYTFIVANYIVDYKGEKRWEVFTDSVFNVFDTRNFETMYFPYHLQSLRDEILNKIPDIKALVENEKYEIIFNEAEKIIVQLTPAGDVREMIRFYIYKYIISSFDNIDSIEKINTFCGSAQYKVMLEGQVLKKIAAVSGEKIVSDGEKNAEILHYLGNGKTETIKNIDILHYIAEQYNGKVIYLDIWASWCGPCLKEMNLSNELHNFMAGKDVAFVNICLESNLDKWLKTLDKNKIPGDNYFLGENAGALFRGNYKISGFPTYIIIDRNQTIHRQVPRPSNLEQAIETLNQNL